jgi:large repetitive protein
MDVVYKKISSFVFYLDEFYVNFAFQKITMMNKYLFLLLVSIFGMNAFAQAPGCPQVQASGAAPLCEPGDCANISATYFNTGATNSYVVGPVTYAPPYPFVGGTQISVNTDDVWSSTIALPFNFCFYGANYSQVKIGSNGVITFDTSVGDGCPWAYSTTIPNINFPIQNAIYGVYQDIDPAIDNAFANPNINYQLLGEYPCRTLVVNFSQVAQFGGTCNNNANIGAQTSQIVMYETTNVIEVYVQRRVPCTAWQNGVGVIGIQNAGGTQAVTPPGRNTGAWSATNEAWRFTPSGPSIVTFEWLEGGSAFSNSLTTQVCPMQTTTYVARATYLRCDGTTVIKEAPVTVEVSEPMVLGEPDDIILCVDGPPPYTFDLTQNNDTILNGLDPDIFTITFHHTQLDAEEGYSPINGPESYVLSGDEEVIYARVEDYFTGCDKSTSFIIKASEDPTASTPPTPQVCDVDNDGTEVFNLTDFDGDALAGQDPDQFVVSYHTTLGGATDNTLPVNNPMAFPATDGQTVYIRVTNVDNDDCFAVSTLSFEITPIPEVIVPADAFACSDEGYTLPALAVGNYFTATGGPDGTGTLMNSGDILYTSQTVYIYAESNTLPNNCTDEDNFEVTIYELPVVDEPAPIAACESYFLDPLTVGQYYTGPDGTGDMLAAGTEVTESVDLYIYAESGTQATVVCTDQSIFEITIDKRPVLVAATPLEVCDDNYDGIATFNLVPAGVEVVNGANGVVVSYHATEANAQNNMQPINNPDTYPSASGTIYVRAINASSTTDCYSIEPVQLIVHPKPVVVAVSPYIVCDDNNSPDGVEFFDLTTKTTEVTTNTDVTVTYHTTQANAMNDVQDIADATAYESGSGVVWARLESGFGCFSVTSFELVVNPLPIVDTNLAPFYSCEEEPDKGLFDLSEIGPLVTMGASGYSVAYFANLDDAQNHPESYLPTPYLSPSTTIYVRVVNVNTECAVITTADLQVRPAPIGPDMAPIEECDVNNDKVATFNMVPALESIEAQLGNAVNAIPYETYNDAFYDATNNIIPNPSTYDNVVAQTSNGVQIIYVRVEWAEAGQTECFDIVELRLIVHPVPKPIVPEPYILCDNGSDDTDGVAIFDLTTLESTILGPDQDPAEYTVTFYNDLGLIPTPASYSSPSNIIIARVTNNATGCFKEIDVELIVNPLPIANDPTPYTLCDYDTPGNETEVFDLTTKIDEIISVGGVPQSGIVTTFYHTYEDAVGGINAIPNPEAYPSAGAVETIFVKVEIEATGCYRIVLLDVRVAPLPTLVLPTTEELTVCDTTGLGIGIFDLDALVEDMVNGAPNLVVTFHFTPQDAENGLHAIPNTDSFQNTNPGVQTLYVRVVDTATDCTNAEPYAITLVVLPAPIMDPEGLEDLVLCDDQDNDGQDGKAYFDLTVQDVLIHNATNTDQVSLTIHYFTSEANAQNGAPRITNPAHYYGTNGQTVWVRIETPDTECFSITSFDLELNMPLLLETPSMLIMCDVATPLSPDINDGRVEFDLTVKDDEILGEFGIGHGNTVTYYELDPRTTADVEPIPDPTKYVNPAPPQGNPKTLFVMVTTPEGCKSYTTLTIKVLPLPQPDMDVDPLEQCDVNNSPDGEEIFDLTDAESDIRNNDFNMVLTYYTSEEDAENRQNQIGNITSYNSGNATIWVRAEANTQDPQNPVCFVITHFDLIVTPLPELGEAGVIEPYAICEQNTDGIATFDFNTHMDEILGDDADPADYTVTFYRDATAQAQGIAMPYIYTNSNPAYNGHQSILVEVRNNESECTITAPLELYVEEAATANPVTETFFECDYDGTNDGVFTFDLTRADDDALGTQNPADYSVTYYTTAEDADAGTNAIANPTGYQNTPDYQVIWVRVTNEATISGCYEVTTMELFVERIPEPVLSTDHTTVCINFNTGDAERVATISSGLDATHTFVWFKDGAEITGQIGTDLVVTEPGSYTVVATSSTGCVSDPIPAMVIEQSGPAAAIGDGFVVGNAFSDDQVITVLVEGFGEYEFRLDDGPWQNSNVFENVVPGDHIVQVRDTATADPCDDLYLILEIGDVSVIDYPNFFTPNGDGYNDYWNIIGLGGDTYNAVIYIFDRYGKLIKQISPDSPGWDGTYNGQPLLADDYWFTVTYTEGGVRKELKAHFAMKR